MLIIPIGDAEPATKIELADGHAGVAQFIDERQHTIDGCHHRRQVKQVGTDVTGDAFDAQVLIAQRFAIERRREGDVYAKLVFA